jgi:phosphatidylinositol 3-kinase
VSFNDLQYHSADETARTLSDLYVSCQLLADNKPLTIPFRTSFKAFKNNYTCALYPRHLTQADCSYRWNEWITLPIRYCDLPLSSQITFTVWDIGGPRTAVPVGGSTFRMFGKKWYVRYILGCMSGLYGHHIRTLRRGKHRLLLWTGQEADGSMQTKTPSKLGVRDEMGRLEKAGKVICVEYVRSWFTLSAREEI